MNNLLYVGIGAFMQWIITTEEGKKFANRVVKKGYDITVDAIKKSGVLNEKGIEHNREISISSRPSGGVQSNPECKSDDNSRNNVGASSSK